MPFIARCGSLWIVSVEFFCKSFDLASHTVCSFAKGVEDVLVVFWTIYRWRPFIILCVRD
jgi:hypothetical protein